MTRLWMTRRISLKFLTALIVGALCFSAFSAQAGKDPEGFVQKLGQEALTTLGTAAGDEEVISDHIRKWLNNYFDKQTIARSALGRHWREASESQRDEYTAIFEKMIVMTYAQRLKEYSGEEFEVTGQTEINERDTIVQSRIIPSRAGAPQTRVEWRVRTTGKKMKIIDVLVEGVSMTITQRADFDAAIQRNGGDIDKFIESLRAKVG